MPPDLAYACQQSVPLVKDDALSLLTGLRAWFQWQSTFLWIKIPPAEWPFAPVDLAAGVQTLSDQVQNGTLTSEIDFEWQLVDLINSVHDGHLTFTPDTYAFFFYLNPLGSLVSVSTDGKQSPEIYLYGKHSFINSSRTDAKPVSQTILPEVFQRAGLLHPLSRSTELKWYLG